MIGALAERLLARRPAGVAVFVVGVTGGVAAGKSTLAAALADELDRRGEGPVAAVSTDGFLRPNAELDAAGLTLKKGWPQTYDAAAMEAALAAIRVGPARFPGYSHLTYDIHPALERTLDRPRTLLLEGLGFSRRTPVDVLVYLDADEADLEDWYVERFVGFCRQARAGAGGFYSRFEALDDAGAAQMARLVWRSVNLPNVRENIAPLRGVADVVLLKGPGHVWRGPKSPCADRK